MISKMVRRIGLVHINKINVQGATQLPIPNKESRIKVRNKVDSLIFLAPLLILFVLSGLVLSWTTNNGISNGWSSYTIGSLFLAEYSPVTMEAINFFQINIWSLYFLSFTIVFLFTILGKYLEWIYKNKIENGTTNG